jgi:hypothetical protein
MLQFGASLTDNARSVNYDRNTFIIQATEYPVKLDREQTHHLAESKGLKRPNIISQQREESWKKDEISFFQVVNEI